MQTNYKAGSASRTNGPRRSAEYHRIPDELKRTRRWMGTRLEPRKGQPGKFHKPPYRVRAGQPIIKADKTNPDNWTTFEDALGAYERGAVDAIGLVVTEDDALWALDVDDVIDSETGEINAAAHHIVHALGTYAEISCSGGGLRAIGIGTKPEYAGCVSNALGFKVELYDGTSKNPKSSGAAFLVMTGNRLPGTPEGVEERQGELEALCRQLWPKQKKRPRKPSTSAAHSLDDAELLERARRSRTGAKFRKLFDRGDTSGYPSESEADYALLNMLAFWTAGDAERMVRLFEQSALHRPDEKHRDYVELSARNALASYTGKFYKPRLVKTLEPDAKEAALAPYLQLLLDPAAWPGARGASAFKAYAAAFLRAAEHGIDADGDLRTGSDVRTLAEDAGMSKTTLRRSTLPYLVQEKKLLRWRPGKGKQAGEFVLLKPDLQIDPNRMSTHLSGVNLKVLLDTLRLLIRMRGGRDKRAMLERQGPLFLFATVALLSAAPRGYSAQELRAAMGRKVYGQQWHKLTARLKAAGVARERVPGRYTLTDSFRSAYEDQLRYSGIVRAEKEQKKRHAEDRRKREEALERRKRGEDRGDVKRSDADLKGPDAMQQTLAGMEPEYRRKRQQNEQSKVGRVHSAEQRVRQFVREGMDERFARRVVYDKRSPEGSA